MSGFLSGLSSGLRKFFTKDRVLIVVGFIVLSVVFMYYSSGKTSIIDGMNTQEQAGATAPNNQNQATPLKIGNESNAEEKEKEKDKEGFQGYCTQDVANPSELLPKDDNSQWASLNPVSQSNPQMPDLLQAGYHIGLDTVGQTMKNANLQLRSDPVIQKSDIGPWNQSTIEPDLMRVPLEVGSTCPK